MEQQILEFKTPWPLMNVEDVAGELIVSFHPESFLWPAVEEIGIALDKLLEELEDCRFILDFANVDYLSGMGLEKLIHLHSQLKTKGQRLALKNVSPVLLKLFHAAGMQKEFILNPVTRFVPSYSI
jgi:anti-anti-sigma factor